MSAVRVRGLRWQQMGDAEAVVAPRYAYTGVAAFILAFNAIIFGVLIANPQPGKQWPWFMVPIWLVVAGFLVGMLFYPWWGGQHVSFRDGVFVIRPRRGARVLFTTSVSELSRFSARPTENGYEVYAETSAGSHKLELAFGNPLSMTSGSSAAARALRARENQDAAELVASHLTEMLTKAREGHGSYRR